MTSPSTPVAADVAVARWSRGDELAEISAGLLRQAPRAIAPVQVLGLLSAVQAHPSIAAAEDYAARKGAQAERLGRRVEQQFWEQVRAVLQELPARDPLSSSSRLAEQERLDAALAHAFAQHLVAENGLRLAQQEEAAASGSSRRGGPAMNNRPSRAGGQ